MANQQISAVGKMAGKRSTVMLVESQSISLRQIEMGFGE
jgi:hypothetical protein